MNSFKNPIGTDVIKAIRDPFIILDNDTYYLTGTTVCLKTKTEDF